MLTVNYDVLLLSFSLFFRSIPRIKEKQKQNVYLNHIAQFYIEFQNIFEKNTVYV